ncbi:MAG: FAD-dependent oxidoreductase [Verrucomicrobiia bacterium]
MKRLLIPVYICIGIILILGQTLRLSASELFVEAESFTNLGGWLVDQQFVEIMGSPYLIAHGLGKPVADAVTTVNLPSTGAYRLWVRTKNWTYPETNAAGPFKVSINNFDAPVTFGITGNDWFWQDGGIIQITNTQVELRLRDRYGFDARCDALYFTTETNFIPPNVDPQMQEWRRQVLGLPQTPAIEEKYDFVVVGGGLAGCAAAIAAAKSGLKVALIQDRPWLGGNASRDIRVHTMGAPRHDIIVSIGTPNYKSGSDEAIRYDEIRQQIVTSETNITLFTEWRAFRVQTESNKIVSVDARHVRAGEERRFSAPLFADCTGDGWIGYWAGAIWRMGREAKSEFNESLAPDIADSMTLGSTLIWNSTNKPTAVQFPKVPWAASVAKDYTATGGDWDWEYGMNLNTIYDAEKIRDHLLQAIYGSFYNAKQLPQNSNLDLHFVAYIAGKRESRRLIGDYILTENDVRNHPVFPDAVATGTWSIDLHYPRSETYDFLSRADQRAVSQYWIPFRSLYSTNIVNLMMAGRCLSATHVGLGSPRVMNTCGQMGLAVGFAASLCKKYNVLPRQIAANYADELKVLLGISVPPNVSNADFACIIDNKDSNKVAIVGNWTSSTYESGYYGSDYIHDGNTDKGLKSITFTFDVPLTGDYDVYFRYTTGGNRASNVPIDIQCATGLVTVSVNEQENGSQWVKIATLSFNAGNTNWLKVRTDGTTGYVTVDAAGLVPHFDLDPRFTANRWQDDDGDGICNYVEYLNGTDPADPLSYIKVGINKAASARTINVLAIAGKSYSILYRNSATAGEWKILADIEPLPITRVVEVSDDSTDANRFYKIVSPKYLK